MIPVPDSSVEAAILRGKAASCRVICSAEGRPRAVKQTPLIAERSCVNQQAGRLACLITPAQSQRLPPLVRLAGKSLRQVLRSRTLRFQNPQHHRGKRPIGRCLRSAAVPAGCGGTRVQNGYAKTGPLEASLATVYTAYTGEKRHKCLRTCTNIYICERDRGLL